MYDDDIDIFEGEPPTEEIDVTDERDEIDKMEIEGKKSLGDAIMEEIEKRKYLSSKNDKSGGLASRYRGKRPRSLRGIRKKGSGRVGKRGRTEGGGFKERKKRNEGGKRTRTGNDGRDPAYLGPEGIVEDARTQFSTCMSADCKNMTNRSSGYCEACEQELGPYLTRDLLRCANCPIRPTCPRGRNPYGVCLYELDFDKEKVKEKDEIEQKMVELLHRDEKVVNRFFILLNSINLNSPDGIDMYSKLSKDMKQWSQLFFDHLKTFGTFKGWSTATKEEVEKFKMRMKGVVTILGKGVTRKNYKVKAEGDPLKRDEQKLPAHIVKIEVPPVSYEVPRSSEFEVSSPPPLHSSSSPSSPSSSSSSSSSSPSPSYLSENDDEGECVRDIEEKIAIEDDTMEEDLRVLEGLQEEYEKKLETDGSSLTGLSSELGWSSDKGESLKDGKDGKEDDEEDGIVTEDEL